MEFSFGVADILMFIIQLVGCLFRYWLRNQLLQPMGEKKTSYSYFLFDEKSFFMALNSSSKWELVEKLGTTFLNHGICCLDMEYCLDWQR